MAVKAQKELELKVHEEFYKNVFIVTVIYPPTKDFANVFKKEMFIKSNKAGFQQVVYYLLNILDPDKLKQNVKSWPPYNMCLENQFRNEVMNYVNELNSIYEDADMPQLAKSHVISPGGFKFLKFMLKLSQLVLLEQAKRNPQMGLNMLLPIKPCKREFVTIENLKKVKIITNKITKETTLLMSNFENSFEAAKREGEKIVGEQQNANKRLKENQHELHVLKKQFDQLPACDFEQSHMEQEVETKLATLKRIKQGYAKLTSLNRLLTSSDVQLEHTELKVPSEVSHIVCIENGNLDLSSMLEGCNVLIDRRRLEVKAMSDRDLLRETERFDNLNQRFTFMNENLEEMRSELSVLSEKIQNESLENSSIPKRRPLRSLQLTENDSDSTVLAEPLPPSPSSVDGKHNFQFGANSGDNSVSFLK